MSILSILRRVFVRSRKPAALPDLPLEQLLWALEVQCGAHSVAFDKELASQRFEGMVSLQRWMELAGELKLDAKVVARDAVLAKDRKDTLLGFVPASWRPRLSGEAAEGSQPEQSATTPVEAKSAGEWAAVLVLQAAQDKALVLRPGATRPVVVSWQELVEALHPQALLVSRVWSKGEEKPLEFGYAWLARELRKHKAIWRDVVLASLAIQGVSLLTPLMTQTVIDKVITNRAQSTLEVMGVGLLILTLFSAALSWVRQYLVLHTGNRVDAVLGSKVFGHLTHLPMPFFETRPTGTLVTRLHGVETIREFITGTFITLVLDLPFMLVFLCVMVYYSPLLSLVTLSVALLMAGISFLVAPRLREKSNEQFMAGARIQAFSTEYIGGMETVKSLQMENRVESQYSQHMGSYMQKGFEARQFANTYNAFMSGLDQVSSLAVLCIGAWMAMQESGFTIGMLVAFQMISGKVTQPLLRLSGLWQQFQQANIAVERLGDVMNVPVERFSLIPSSVRSAAPKLEVKDLGFSYSPDRKPLYEGLNFSIEAGQCVALVGPSGCGKSTIAKLFQGFYPGYHGQLLVAGRELRTLAVNELRTWFGVVPQETTLFSGTIADNLHAADPHASLERMAQACRLAGVHDAIERLPQGYQTEIGERGVGLSGGQKQRLAIARALLKGAKVLIFDEATANLDPASAQAVADTVNHLKGKLTIVFVAHNLPPNLRVDRVIKLPEGVDVPMTPSGPSGAQPRKPSAA